MAAPRKYNDEQRAAILKLRVAGCSIGQIIERCSRGVSGLDPFTPSKTTISEILNGNDKPSEIADLQLADAFDQLARRQMELISRELERLHTAEGPLDADAALKLARTMRELEPLVKPQPNGNGNDKKPPGTLARLATIEQPTNGHSNGNGGTITPLRSNGDLTPRRPDAA